MASDQPLQNGEEPQRLSSQESVIIKPNYSKEFLAGLTVSFVAMSLGAAFGDQSLRGPIYGILSAGVIALITAAIGGTRVQCSGPTAPMTAVALTLVQYIRNPDFASSQFVKDFPEYANDPLAGERFCNLAILLTGLLLAVLGLCRAGSLITLVPKAVISGFMNGIAVLIWYGEVKNFFGIGGKTAMTGNLFINLGIALCVTFMIFNFGKLTGKLCPAYKNLFPGTLIVMVLVTALVQACGGLGIQTVKTGDPINSFDDITAMFSENFPSIWTGGFIAKALPNAITLCVLGYLDTLLTSLVVDQKVDEKFSKSNRWPKTAKNQELVAQGIANGAVAFFGGLPGAQATIRSVLILNEGAMTRVAGISVGILVIVEMLALQNLIGFIPQCVFSGILLKVGYDVFDWTPFFIYLQTGVARKEHPAANDKNREDDPVVSHINFAFIIGASVVTVVFGLNQAVGVFTLLYWLIHKLVMPVPDLISYAEAQSAKVAVADDAAVLA